MKQLIAVLLNPTIDQIYEIENFHVGGTFKVNQSVVFPVGKAISFSLGVRQLNDERNIIKVIACIGKDEIPLYSTFLKSKKIDFEFIEVNGKTRSNKTINDPIEKTTTHIREKGFDLDGRTLAEFKKVIKNNMREGNLFTFSGSIPPNVNDDIYFEFINSCREIGLETALDANGTSLTEGIKAKPTIIKPNLLELSQILRDPKLNDLNFSDNHQALDFIMNNASKLLDEKTKIILITLGKNGAILLTKNKHFYGNIKVEQVIDTVGSGDSFLAGFILNYFKKKDMLECFKHALACGAANTLIPGPGIFKKEDAMKLYKKIILVELS
ncbi:MAG: hypothetical protein EU542_04075 [Promethearchaeota archaeon]|nr:MAG: hypothetical protein EU542_04075 [Candidatus Lokiarchaeota archaeon]